MTASEIIPIEGCVGCVCKSIDPSLLSGHEGEHIAVHVDTGEFVFDRDRNRLLFKAFDKWSQGGTICRGLVSSISSKGEHHD